jgi:multidrug efflux pump subunit AcrA (membrane-fusion protein)
MSKKQRGQISLIAIVIVALLAVVAVVGLAMRGRGDSSARASQNDAFAVRRGDFDISIPVSGELAALKQIEIRNNLDTRAIITEIVPEGTFVQANDVVLRLNDDEIRTKLRDAQDKLNVASSALITAEATYDIQLQTRTSELAKADLAIKLAVLALKSWQEGEDLAKRKELALAIETATKEYARLQKRFDESGGLLEKKFISEDEFKKDEIAMMQAKSNLELAKLAEKVYLEYTFEQTDAQKKSDLEQAHAERKRVEQEQDAQVRSAKSDVDSKQFQLDSAKETLAEFQQELAHCTVQAPAAGLVVYYSSMQSNGWGRNEGRPPQVGTELTRNEPVMILPDTSQMIAAVKISEALSGMIKPGQRATVISDALADRSLQGEVISVGVLAETGGWRDPNRREYTVKIKINDANDYGLKPAMRCKANIYIGQVSEALHIPVQAVFRAGSIAYVYVPQGRAGYAQKKITLGRSSELFIEVLDGVSEDDIVLLREPQSDEVVSRIELPRDEGNRRRGDGSGNGANGSNGGAAKVDQPTEAPANATVTPTEEDKPRDSDDASSERGQRRGSDGAGGRRMQGDDSAKSKSDSEPVAEKPTANAEKPATQ